MLAGFQAEPDASFRETDLGSWDGLTFDEVREQHGDDLRAIYSGEAVPFGGTGETLVGFEARVLEAFDALCAEVGDGSALVFTHGGVIDACVGRALGRPEGRRAVPIASNTSMTVFEGRPSRLRLSVFNDSGHLGLESGFLAAQKAEGARVVGFVRHGVTMANQERKVQGRSGRGLTDEGVNQARLLAEWYGSVDSVYSSPLDRAAETASILAAGGPVEMDDDLAEMAFGEWEGLGYEEMRKENDAVRIWTRGEDLPRGGTGESFGQVQERMMRFLRDAVVPPHKRVIAVTHGGSILALAAVIAGRGFDISRSLETSANARVTHVVVTDRGPMLADYSVGKP